MIVYIVDALVQTATMIAILCVYVKTARIWTEKQGFPEESTSQDDHPDESKSQEVSSEVFRPSQNDLLSDGKSSNVYLAPGMIK